LDHLSNNKLIIIIVRLLNFFKLSQVFDCIDMYGVRFELLKIGQHDDRNELTGALD